MNAEREAEIRGYPELHLWDGTITDPMGTHRQDCQGCIIRDLFAALDLERAALAAERARADALAEALQESFGYWVAPPEAFTDAPSREYDRVASITDALAAFRKHRGFPPPRPIESSPCCRAHVSQVGVMNPTKCPTCGARLYVRDRKWWMEPLAAFEAGRAEAQT